MNVESYTLPHLQALCEQFGPRPVGSQGNLLAGDYIERLFRSAGLHVCRQPFPCTAWHLQNVTLRLGQAEQPVIANPFSPPCDVTAPGVALCSLAELAAANLTERIAVLYGELAKAPLVILDTPHYLPERDRQIVELLHAKRPAALITIGDVAGATVPLTEDWALKIPAATVSAEVGLHVRQHQGPMRLKIASYALPAQGYNLVGSRPGVPQRGPERVILCAHYDTKFYTPGAWDNASGTAVLLTLARLLPPMNLDIGLEFVALGGEEYAPGCNAYLESYGLGTLSADNSAAHRPSDLDHVIAAIQVDSVAQTLGSNTVSVVATSEGLQQLAYKRSRAYPGLVALPGGQAHDPWPAGNSCDFPMYGVPSITLGSSGGASLRHRSEDTPRWISPGKLSEVVAFISDLVVQLQDKSPIWARPAPAHG